MSPPPTKKATARVEREGEREGEREREKERERRERVISKGTHTMDSHQRGGGVAAVVAVG